MSVQVPVGFFLVASITPVDAQGNIAKVDGAPVWTCSDLTKAALVIAEDGLSAEIHNLALGNVQIGVSADADLGEGVATISGILDVELVGGQAVDLRLATGPLQPEVAEG